MTYSYYAGLGLPEEQQRIADNFLVLAPTDELIETVKRRERYLAELPDTYNFDPRRLQASKDIEYAKNNLQLGIERDAIQATRPEGCWCLGVGGREPRSERVGDQTWHFFGRHCSCPEGVARRKLDRTQENAAADAKAHRRAVAFRDQLPVKFQHLTLKSYPSSTPEQQAVLEHIRAWLKDDFWEDADGNEIQIPQWLLLHGPYGTGKTGLASALGVEMLETHFVESVHIAAVPRLLDRVRATYSRQDDDDEREADVMEELFDVECLILDDLGAERATDWATEKLFTLINHRHDQELITVITTNLAPSELGAHIGERTMWRIAEMSYVVSLEGCPNLRMPTAQQSVARRKVIPLSKGAA
jgi:DNA replication protein DnaC